MFWFSIDNYMCNVVHFVRISLTSHEDDLVIEIEMHRGLVVEMISCTASTNATPIRC